MAKRDDKTLDLTLDCKDAEQAAWVRDAARPFKVIADAIYPDAPGFQDTDTSRAAADSFAAKAKPIREQVLRCLKAKGPQTSEEISAAIGVKHNSVQPRTSELKVMELIEDSKLRRETECGKQSIVWRAK